MPIIPLDTLDDPRLDDYRLLKDRQLLPEFSPGWHGRDLADPALYGKFMAEGEVVFERLVRSTCRTLSVLATPSRLGTIGADLALLSPEVPVYVVSAGLMERLAGFPIHRGLLAIGARPAPADLAGVVGLATPARPLLVLENLVNHDNIGGIFRNAAAFGAAGVLLTPRCADPLYRKALRVSVGWVLGVPWAVLRRWPEDLAMLKRAGLTTVALTPAGSAVSLEEFAGGRRQAAAGAAAGPLALILGTEGPGLDGATVAAADAAVRIRIDPRVDSLNVAVTAAVALHALCHPV